MAEITIDDPGLTLICLELPSGLSPPYVYDVAVYTQRLRWSKWVDVTSNLRHGDFVGSVAYFDAVQECIDDLNRRLSADD